MSLHTGGLIPNQYRGLDLHIIGTEAGIEYFIEVIEISIQQ